MYQNTHPYDLLYGKPALGIPPFIGDKKEKPMPEKENLLLKYFDEELVPAMREQIKNDQKRWGDTWKHRPVEGQVTRVFQRYADYLDQFFYGDEPMPWLKVIGEANICMAREAHPEWLESEEDWFGLNEKD